MINFDLHQFLRNIYTKKVTLTYLLALFVILICFGNKLAFNSYASDDYMRIFVTEEWYLQADRGRWFTSFLNHFVFNNESFIAPYFNTVIALVFISLSALLTTRIWRIKSNFITLLLILLLSVSPFWSNNLYYNSNVTVSIGLFLSSFGLYYGITRKSWSGYVWAVVLFTLGFAVYQTVFQSTIIVLVTWYLLKGIRDEEDLFAKKAILELTKWMLLIFLAFGLSHIIGEIIINLSEPEYLFNPYQKVTRESGVLKIFNKVVSIYTSPGSFFNALTPNTSFLYLTAIIILTGLIALFTNPFKFGKRKSILACILLLLFLINVVQIPRFLSLDMPVRASFHFSFFLAVFCLICFHSKVNLLKSLAILFCFAYLVTSVKYITVFYDNANKQTQQDIVMANQIVDRIYMHEDYENIGDIRPNLLLVGEKNFSLFKNKSDAFIYESKIKGALYITENAFNRDWSKYKAVKHFTSFQFDIPDKNKTEELLSLLSKKDSISSYPEKNSVQIIGDAAIVILDDSLVPSD